MTCKQRMPGSNFPPAGVIATVIDSMGGTLGIDATATIDAAVSLHVVLTLGAPGTVDLKCNVVDPVAGT